MSAQTVITHALTQVRPFAGAPVAGWMPNPNRPVSPLTEGGRCLSPSGEHPVSARSADSCSVCGAVPLFKAPTRTVVTRAENQGVHPVRLVLVRAGEGALMGVDSREVGEWRAQGLEVEIVEVAEAPSARGVSLAKPGDYPNGVVMVPSEVALDELRDRRGCNVTALAPLLPIGAERALDRGDLRALGIVFEVAARVRPRW